jgi:hypothetical protein
MAEISKGLNPPIKVEKIVPGDLAKPKASPAPGSKMYDHSYEPI